MIDPLKYLNVLQQAGVGFFTGVPDSLLKDICACITDQLSKDDHIIAANEGGAVGLAIGYHLATGQVPIVYLQNSGLGNVVNPVMSLASDEVYGLPMVLLIGWRGEPGVKDEPQHVHQGRVTPAMLDSMDVPYTVLSDDLEDAAKQTSDAVELAKSKKKPVALLVRKGTFESYKLSKRSSELQLSREEAIVEVSSLMEDDAAVIGTTGMPSRELFEFRASTGGRHETDFLTVGGMGHASQIALGLALRQPERPVYCLDGDGAAIMHMGSMVISGSSDASNLIHIVLNNGAHESVGGQPTVGFDIDLPAIAIASGYKSATRVTKKDDIPNIVKAAQQEQGPSFIEIQVKPGHRSDLGRPTSTPAQNKQAMMKFLAQ